MATYEKVTRETARFDVVDANDRQGTVVEYTTFFLRISLHKQYSPMVGGVTYQLLDGRPVHRTHGGHFDTSNGLCRFFALEERAYSVAGLGWGMRNATSKAGPRRDLH
ncbi:MULTISPECIES: hypothetical protein [unclassified Variovorax]|uniref:hypothetical protein n=1 Tax=unclassified Variovorax TaxID=663243 RepID=UPI003F45D511